MSLYDASPLTQANQQGIQDAQAAAAGVLFIEDVARLSPNQQKHLAFLVAQPERLKLREMALSEAVLRAPPRRPAAANDVPVQTVYRTIFERLTAQYGPIQVRLLADPTRVPPSQYSAYCTLAVAMFRTVSALPTEQAGIVMSHIFGNLRTAK